MAVWTLDDLGNWTEFRNDAGDGETWDLDQNRVHNTANEIHGNSGDPIHPEGGSGGWIRERIGASRLFGVVAWDAPDYDIRPGPIRGPRCPAGTRASTSGPGI
jgi:hypothetical protein